MTPGLLILSIAAMLSSVSADVGFEDSAAYLAIGVSTEGDARSFSLSEDSALLAHIDLKSDRFFKVDKLEELFYHASVDAELRPELLDMLSSSFMSSQKSRVFLENLASILSKYDLE